MVTTTADAPENTPEAVGTFRQAIFDANQMPDHDTIVFDPAFFGEPKTITLTEGQLSITEAVTIDATIDGDGPSQELLGITIDAGGSPRIFSITKLFGGGTGEVDINGFTLTGTEGGAGFGAIDTLRFDVTVKNTIITGNATNGILAVGANLTVEHSTISNNGGIGIAFSPALEFGLKQLDVVDGTISGNQDSGITIYGVASATIQDSLITGNDSQSEGGGIRADVRGNFQYAGHLRIERSEISGNTSQADGGGIYVRASTAAVEIVDTKIISDNAAAGNGGGIRENDLAMAA